MTSVPSIETLPWEAGGPQEVKAWVCRVNARHQGVVEYDKVIAIRQEGGLYRDPSRLIVWGVQDTVIGNHALDEIWGAWIAWPYKTFRTSEGYAPMGPRYFLEFGFKQYEWTARNGAVMKRHDPSPKTYSIWCDGSDTDQPIATATRLRWDDYNGDVNGWLRADRINWQARKDNRKFPSMP